MPVVNESPHLQGLGCCIGKVTGEKEVISWLDTPGLSLGTTEVFRKMGKVKTVCQRRVKKIMSERQKY